MAFKQLRAPIIKVLDSEEWIQQLFFEEIEIFLPNPALQQLISVCRSEAFTIDSGWMDGIPIANKFENQPAEIATASLLDIQKALSVHFKYEALSPGQLKIAVDSGQLKLLLQRALLLI